MARSKKVMTLDRVLSRFGLISRKVSGEAIRSGRVKVNGRIVRNPETWTDPTIDAVHLDGKRIRRVRRTYLLFYKPKGVITSHGDRQGRKTVYDCLDPSLPWVATVGRLDKDTSGLILLTNDTEFSNFVTNPSAAVRKTYLVKANMLVDDALVERMSGGFRMKNGQMAKPQSVVRVENRGKYSWLETVLTEGKNREIHRLLESAGLKVLKMVRTRIGPCTLQGLQVGQCRALSKAEMTLLYSHSTSLPASSSAESQLRNRGAVSRTKR